MLERVGSGPLSETVAAKCELCRGYEGQACVQACPTEAIFRVRPARDIRDVQALFGASEDSSFIASSRAERISLATVLYALVAAASVAVLGFGLAMQRAGYWYPAGGYGLLAGIAAGVCMLALLAYLIPKRFIGLWMRKTLDAETSRQRSRSRMRPLLAAHIVVGVAACAVVLAHAGLRVPGSPAGALHLAFWIAALSGLFGAWAYRSIPRRLTRLESGSALPEDLIGRRQTLLDSLYRQSSGREELVKAIASRVLVPYARSPLGGLRLLSSQRTQNAERARLRGIVEEMIASRGTRPLVGLDALIETVVELRALPMRRFLGSMLRGWLPLHIVAIAMASALLVLHVALVVGR